MKFVVLKHIQPAKQVPFPRRRYLEMMADAVDKKAAETKLVEGKTTGAKTAGRKTANKGGGETELKGQDVHYDLMLETEEGLLTWAMGCLPAAGKSCGAIQLPLHRELYLTHQGPVSAGRGTVERVMEGRYELLSTKLLILHRNREPLAVEMNEIQQDHYRFTFKSSPQTGATD